MFCDVCSLPLKCSRDAEYVFGLGLGVLKSCFVILYAAFDGVLRFSYASNMVLAIGIMLLGV